MLFEFCGCNGFSRIEYGLLSDVVFHDGYLEANLISDCRCEPLGVPFYLIHDDPQKFLAMGPIALIEYKGEVVDVRSK
ncbi:MAG: hypothetical protein K6B70_01355 [Clostridia bacterium]|nr:hypothetical protein [Clostridia bacterium]